MQYVTHIVQDEVDDNPVASAAYAVIVGRLGRVGELRGDDRTARQAFVMLRAAKARLRITRVVTHECRHDEGIGDCRDAVAVVG